VALLKKLLRFVVERGGIDDGGEVKDDDKVNFAIEGGDKVNFAPTMHKKLKFRAKCMD
jgi:hypothetical protein